MDAGETGFLTLRLTDAPDARAVEAIEAGLADYNEAQAGYRDWRPLTVLVTDPSAAAAVEEAGARARVVGDDPAETAASLERVPVPEGVTGWYPDAEEGMVVVETLAPGGYLFFGYAESLREFDSLEALRSEDGAVYRRPLKGTLPVRPPVPSAKPPAPLPLPLPLPAPAPKPDPAVTVRLSGSYETARDVSEQLRAAITAATSKVVVDLDGADYLADEVASALRRAAAAAAAVGLGFELRATRPGPRRFLSRHRLETR